MPSASRLQKSVEREARRLDGKIGVCLARVGEGPAAEVRADEAFPLASVFKLGVLVELFRQVDAGRIGLRERWTVRPELQSLESGVLMFLDAGLRPTVHDLATLMIIVSDNTAADMLFKRVGIRSVNPTLRGLGLRNPDIYFPNREWFLLLLGFDPHFRGLTSTELARRWAALETEARLDEVEWLMEQGRDVSLRAMRDRYGRKERAGLTATRAWRHLEQVTDNWASPRDIGRLLDLLARRRAASLASCRRMVDILRGQQYRRLANGLPPGTAVASKTGGIAGVVNDAGIVYPRHARPFVAVCLTQDLTPAQETLAPTVIARIARAAWDAWA